jgi:AcrR family transcriptional regulator
MADTDLARLAASAGHTDAAKRLSRVDWLTTAIRIFVEEGVEAVRITRLATALDVTRGSFYWHFKDRDDLMGGLVAFWKEKNTTALVGATAEASSLAEGVLSFFESVIDDGKFDPRLDQAMRDWSRRAPEIREAVDEADATRIKVLKAFFLKFGYSESEAYIRSRVAYYTQIGYHALNVEERLAERLQYLEEYYEIFTGVPLEPEAAAAFRARHLPDGA